MGKFILLQFILFILPTVFFLLYVTIFQKRKAIQALNPKTLATLVVLGALATGGGALYLATDGTGNVGATYIPASSGGPARLE